MPRSAWRRGVTNTPTPWAWGWTPPGAYPQLDLESGAHSNKQNKQTRRGSSVLFNPNQTGLFVQSKDRTGGVIPPCRFIEMLWPQIYQRWSQMIFGLFILLQKFWKPYCDSKFFHNWALKYSHLTKQNYQLPGWKFLKIYNFWPIWIIYTSNKS